MNSTNKARGMYDGQFVNTIVGYHISLYLIGYDREWSEVIGGHDGCAMGATVKTLFKHCCDLNCMVLECYLL